MTYEIAQDVLTQAAIAFVLFALLYPEPAIT